jgi:sulfopyruvate decarboxylase alpha subunit
LSWQEQFYQSLKANGIRLVCYVPDSALAVLIDLLEKDDSLQVVSVTREEEGVGILAGGYLGGMRGALLFQSSGLGNSINALTSLNIPQQIPFLMVITPRGEVGEFNPFQVPMGRILKPLLDLLLIGYAVLEREDQVQVLVERACRSAFRTNLPVAIILSRDLAGGTVR